MICKKHNWRHAAFNGIDYTCFICGANFTDEQVNVLLEDLEDSSTL